MEDVAKTIHLYCEDVKKFLNRTGPEPSTFPIESLKSLREQSDKSQKELKNEVDRTRLYLEVKIRTIGKTPQKEERLITLYTIEDELSKIHTYLHKDDREKIKKAHREALRAIPLFEKKANKELKAKKNKLTLLSIFIRSLRIITLLTAFVSFVSAFQFPGYVTFLIPYALIAVIFLLPAETLWLKSVEDSLIRAIEKADPISIEKAIMFLENPSILNHLWVLLDDPSLEPSYQHEYIDLLIHIGIVCKWIDTRSDHLEATKETMDEILEEAYSTTPKTYPLKFLNDWKTSFEEIQQEFKKHFGNNPETFFNETIKNEVFFLEYFRSFLKSPTAEKIKVFLQKKSH